VRAVELDAAALRQLETCFGSDRRVEVVAADATALPLPDEPFAVVANLPDEVQQALAERPGAMPDAAMEAFGRASEAEKPLAAQRLVDALHRWVCRLKRSNPSIALDVEAEELADQKEDRDPENPGADLHEPVAARARCGS